MISIVSTVETVGSNTGNLTFHMFQQNSILNSYIDSHWCLFRRFCVCLNDAEITQRAHGVYTTSINVDATLLQRYMSPGNCLLSYLPMV